MSSLALRVLALSTMLIDHLGFVFYPLLPLPVFLAMRVVGRLSMPIFCFLIAEGYYHTRSVGRYIGRLILLAVVAELPYDRVFSGGQSWFNIVDQNVLFTLALGLLAIHMCDAFLLRGARGSALLSVMLCAGLAQFMRAGYGMFGVLFIFVFYCFRDRPARKAAAFLGLCLTFGLFEYLAEGVDLYWAVVLAGAAAAILPILFFNGQRGRGGKLAQSVFYLFYPVHLALLALFAPI
ncbi:MAG: conjugal transfer protein TraX [Oscillospiraceae bacterium]|jgi:hypothetical protein|nr:conjugal transfer protein TraX [Oscillospiraceae bacterium]